MENEKIYELRNTCLNYAIMVTPQTIKEKNYTTEVLETAEKFYEWIVNNKK